MLSNSGLCKLKKWPEMSERIDGISILALRRE
jgi:hypothetical protein